MTGQGKLKFHCVIGDSMKPISRALITVTQCNKMGSYTTQYDNIYSNRAGQSDELILESPSKYASKDPKMIPYYTYNAKIVKAGFRTLIIEGIQVFPNRVALQICRLEHDPNGNLGAEILKIPAHRQVGDYPKKIPEAPIKPLNESGSFSILNKVEVPQYIIVHGGDPDDNSAPNYKVGFQDYIKNCACCELYPTWNDNALRANIYCIVSFTLNRIYTEWYIGQGKNFNITNSTAYDQSFSYGRNIATNIGNIVDELFDTYIQFENNVQPLLAQYCNGTTVTCPGWLSQWGSEYLAEDGYVPYEILTNYYGDNINLLIAENVLGDPISYPGTPLEEGSKGPNVAKKQRELNAIAVHYPMIPKLTVDGIYGPLTENSVKVYQRIFTLPVTGIIDKATWYSISNIYAAVQDLEGMEAASSNRGEDIIFYPPVLHDNFRNIPYIKLNKFK